MCSSQEDPTRPRHFSRLRSHKPALHRSQKALLGETPSASAVTVGSVRYRLSPNHPIAPPPDPFRPKTTDSQWTLRPSESTAACLVVCTRCYPNHLLTDQPTYPRTDPSPSADDLPARPSWQFWWPNRPLTGTYIAFSTTHRATHSSARFHSFYSVSAHIRCNLWVKTPIIHSCLCRSDWFFSDNHTFYPQNQCFCLINIKATEIAARNCQVGSINCNERSSIETWLLALFNCSFRS